MQITPESHVVFQLEKGAEEAGIDWRSGWPDAIAFVLGLAVARWANWNAGDLIWSLWLSSVVVGYTTIVWIIANPAIILSILAFRERNNPVNSTGALIFFMSLFLIGGALMLAFFSFHFLWFHLIQSSFLMGFFPIDVPGVQYPELGGRAVYLEILRRYWVFLPSAFLSHRAVFMRAPLTLNAERWFQSFIGEGKSPGEFLFGPYRNVMRMQVLIILIGFAHVAKLDNFAVYTLIYAVYFFPWRLVRSESSAA